jgi:hypothetical protein
LLGLVFDPEDAVDMFFRNVELYFNYTALQPKSLHSYSCENLGSRIERRIKKNERDQSNEERWGRTNKNEVCEKIKITKENDIERNK